MALSINTNTTALVSNRQLTKASNMLTKTLEQLASARRINRAADDAAGLAIAEEFESAVRQANTEARNLQYGYNAAQNRRRRPRSAAGSGGAHPGAFGAGRQWHVDG